jgi:hypothetical protein
MMISKFYVHSAYDEEKKLLNIYRTFLGIWERNKLMDASKEEVWVL